MNHLGRFFHKGKAAFVFYRKIFSNLSGKCKLTKKPGTLAEMPELQRRFPQRRALKQKTICIFAAATNVTGTIFVCLEFEPVFSAQTRLKPPFDGDIRC